ncbi:MAG TPA: hypothetical protein VIC62_10855 [Nakamurella sp.]|jgi:uncharacterized protein YndB with AHSA1/START domain
MSKAITQLSVVHSTFCIERNYPFPAARVFAAFRDPATKRRWFVEGERCTPRCPTRGVPGQAR